MSLNQLVTPSTPLNVVFNSVTTDEFTNKGDYANINVPSLNAGIFSTTNYATPFLANNFIRPFNDGGSTRKAIEVFMQFSTPLLDSSSGNYIFTYAVQSPYVVGYCDASLFKNIDPDNIVPGQVSQISNTLIQITFAYGSAQAPTTGNAVTKMHLILFSAA